MRRDLWTTRLIPLHLGLLAAFVACVWLGQWQYSRFSEDRAGTVVDKPGPAVPIASLLSPGTNPPRGSLGAQATATGTYLADRQVLLPDREHSGRRGFWLMAPLRVDGGGVAAVVRGWVESATSPQTALPAGRVTVSGPLQAAEPVRDEVDTALPAGEVSAASPVEYLADVDADFYAAILVARSETPSTGAEPEPVELWTHRASAGAGARNLAYAFQWWLFAAFAVFMWWRVLPLTLDRDQQDVPDLEPRQPVRTPS